MRLDYSLLFEKLVDKEINIELLFSKEISKNFIESLDSDMIKKGLKNEKFNIKTSKPNCKFLLALSRNFILLGLFKDDSTFDQNRLLISNQKKAIEWGNIIFNEYYSHGKKLSLLI